MLIIGTVASSFKANTGSPTFELIQKYSVPSNTGTFTFSNIPNTYEDLVLMISVRDTRTSPWGVGYVRLEFNGDTSTSNYYYRSVSQASDSDTVSPSGANSTYYASSGGSDFFPSNIFGSITGRFLGYSSNRDKTGSMEGANESSDGNTYPIKQIQSYRWNNTAAITSIRCYSDANFKQYSNFYLYGVKKQSL